MLRALIIDDNPLFQEAIGELLCRFSGVEVAGTANDGASGLQACAELAPDLVFVDLNMPGMNGLEVTRELRQQNRPTRVIIVSLHDGAEYRSRAAAAGAERFICKYDLFAELLAILGNPPPALPHTLSPAGEN